MHATIAFVLSLFLATIYATQITQTQYVFPNCSGTPLLVVTVPLFCQPFRGLTNLSIQYTCNPDGSVSAQQYTDSQCTNPIVNTSTVNGPGCNNLPGTSTSVLYTCIADSGTPVFVRRESYSDSGCNTLKSVHVGWSVGCQGGSGTGLIYDCEGNNLVSSSYYDIYCTQFYFNSTVTVGTCAQSAKYYCSTSSSSSGSNSGGSGSGSGGSGSGGSGSNSGSNSGTLLGSLILLVIAFVVLFTTM